MSITWCDPPASHTGRWVRLLTPVMDRPGQWARIDEVEWDTGPPCHTAVRELRKGAKKIPPGRWEFRPGKDTDFLWRIWARYLGEAT